MKKSTLMPCAIAIHNIIMTPSQLHVRAVGGSEA